VQQRPIAAADEPPRLWLDASTATICRYALDRPRTESDGELGPALDDTVGATHRTSNAER
jgi:hypothetical protein